MKKLLLLLIIPFLSFGQGWIQIFGEEYSYESGVFVEQSSDGGYIIVGNSFGGTTYNPNIYLIKTNSEGVAEWSQIFGEEGEESLLIQFKKLQMEDTLFWEKQILGEGLRLYILSKLIAVVMKNGRKYLMEISPLLAILRKKQVIRAI